MADVAFIHGAGDSDAVWEFQTAAVGGQHRLLALDLPGHGARLDEPALHVCLFERGGRWAAIRYMAALLLGFLPRLGDYRVIRARSVTIALEPETAEERAAPPVQGDGDVVARLPARITVAERPLRLIVPAAA